MIYTLQLEGNCSLIQCNCVLSEELKPYVCVFIQLVELAEVIQVRAPPGFARLRRNLIGLKWRTYTPTISCNHKLLRCCSEIRAAGIVFLLNCFTQPR